MKKITKIATLALSLGVSAVACLYNPVTLNGVQADSTHKVITIEEFQTEFSGYEEVTLPYGKSGSDNVVPKVYTQNNVEVQDTDATDEAFTFAPEYSVYKVVYSVGDISKTFMINVELANPELTLEENADIILPSTSVTNRQVVIPYPTVLDEDGEALKNAIGEAYSNYEIAAHTTVKVIAPNNSELTSVENDYGVMVDTTNVYASSGENKVYYKAFTPKMLGAYTVKYSFAISNTTTGELAKTINISKTFNTEREITYTLNSGMPTAVLGVEATLPKVTVTDKTNDISNVEAKVKVSVKYIKEDGSYSTPEVVNNYKFTPAVASDYIVTYEVEDYFGNKAATTSYVIRNVVDSKAPTSLLAVDAYTVEGVDTTTEEFKTARVSASYKIPSKIATGTTVTFPAIYAEDNVTALEDLTFSRTIKPKYSSTVSKTFANAFNETETYTFNSENGLPAGTYVVTYSVTDAAGKTTSTNFEISVKDAYADTVAPVISFTANLPKFVKVGEEVTFKKPTAKDYDDADKQVVGSARLNVRTYYFIGDSVPMSGEVVDYTKLTLIEGTSTNLTFKAPNVETNGTKIGVYCEVSDSNGNTSSQVKYMTVLNDQTVPTVDSVADLNASYNQYDNITIPTIVFNDQDSDTINSVVVEVYNRFGNKVAVTGMSSTLEGTKLTISGATFTATQSGEYNYIVTATDLGGNTVIVCDTITAAKVSVPVLKISKETATISLGETFDLDIYKVYDEGIVDDSVEVDVNVVGPSHALANLILTPNTVGEYRVTYTCEAYSISKELVITVTDSQGPVLNFEKGKPTLNIAAVGEVVLPEFTASDNSGEETTLEVTVKYNNEDVAVEKVLSGGYKFNAESTGTYTVVYKATDVNNNETTQSFSIVVGDKTGPVIDFGDININRPATKKLNDTLTLDLSKITISDNYDGEISTDKLTITLRDPDGNKVTGTNYSYELTKAGTYTLTYRVKDAAGNYNSEQSFDIEVKADEIEETSIDNNVGMVIAIIASLAVLAGVIVYFFKPEKASVSVKPSKKDDK